MSRRFIQFIPISYNRKSVLITVGKLEIVISHDYLASIPSKKFVHLRKLKIAPKSKLHNDTHYTTKNTLYTKHNSMQNTLDNRPYWLP